MMTRSLKLAASAFAALLTLAAVAPAAHAQGTVGQVNVPFAFEIGSTHFAPGIYSITRANQSTLRIAGATSSALLMALTETNMQINEQSKAVFLHVGDKYFLTQVWSAGVAEHLVATKSSEFKKALRIQETARIQEAALHNQPLAQPTTAPATTTVALLR